MEELVLGVDGDDDGSSAGAGECHLEVEGIWPAWDPWERDARPGGRASRGDTLSGSARSTRRGGTAPSLSAAGPSPVPPLLPTGAAPRWLGEGLTDLGGSHLPPSELRLTSGHRCAPALLRAGDDGGTAALLPAADGLTQIEMALWGDQDLGPAAEFGAPLRHVVRLPAAAADPDTPAPGGRGRGAGGEAPLAAALEYEAGSRLCARACVTRDGRRGIDLCWRKQGAINLEEITPRGDDDKARSPRRFQDLSLTPLPLSLPSLTLPKLRGHHHGSASGPSSSAASDLLKHAVSSLHWWPDENFGGPPRLAVLTRGGTIIVYEMPPPWSALEPPMPSYDPFDGNESRGSSIDSDFLSEDEDEGSSAVPVVGASSVETAESIGESAHSRASTRAEYEVCIAPHPDFGLGLRLEAQAAGMPAVVGSFKTHPLSGGRLPAERSGEIVLGDELLAVNDVELEGLRFEDAIATVRQIGFDSYGAPLRMRFRKVKKRKSKSPRSSLGSNHNPNVSVKGATNSGGDAGSLATVEVGADAEIQQGFGRVVAIVRDVIVSPQESSAPRAPSPAMLLLPWNFGRGAVVSHKMYGGALILWAAPSGRRKTTIKAARLEAVLDIDPDNARFMELGSIVLEEEERKTSEMREHEQATGVKSISFISSTEKGWLVAIHSRDGNVSLLFVDTSAASHESTDSSNKDTSSGVNNIGATFRHYPSIFNTNEKNVGGSRTKENPQDSSFILRSFSLELFGGMRKHDTQVMVWSALPRSMSGNGEKGGNGGKTSLEYHSATVSIRDIPQLSSSEDVILDFRFVSSGHIEAFPWLVTFTTNAAVVHHRSYRRQSWCPICIFLYKEKSASPLDDFPHLITSLRCAGLTNDEHSGMIKSDWHPESILASICTEEDGVYSALRSYVQGLYRWLSRWMNTEDSKRPGWTGHGSLSSAPFRIMNDKTVLMTEIEPAENSSSLMMATKKPQSEEEVLLSKLQTVLCQNTSSNDELEEDNTQHAVGKGSREFMLAMSIARSKAKKEAKENKEKPLMLLPPPLENLSHDELSCLWAIGDILSNPPSFKKLDLLSQFCLFCVSLMRRLLNNKKVDASIEKTPIVSILDDRPKALGQQKVGEDKAEFDYVASAAMLAALMSDSQLKLLDRCRPSSNPNGERKLSWESARSIGVPFWVRSEKLLRSIADEIAQTIYKTTKDVMECALYYVAMRSMSKLKAIAATDRSKQGETFSKFINDHDFTSDRGRIAAEKNAYSLLRKRKYTAAACFFLLAEPPQLKTALDLIKNKLHDQSLAFFVARLVENAPKSSGVPGADGLAIGGGFSLRSMGGGGGYAGIGGGGFAGSGNVGGLDTQEDTTVQFNRWKPTLGKYSRSVLLPKETADGEDICFESLQLLWLSRPREAALRLSHMPMSCRDGAKEDNSIAAPEDVPFPPIFSNVSIKSSADIADTCVLKKANRIINFCTGPPLLKKMKPKKRVLLTSAFLVSRALSRCGMELPSMRILLQIGDPSYEEEEEQKTTGSAPLPSEPGQQTAVRASNTSSAVFDSYRVTTPPKSKPAASIIESFDAEPAAANTSQSDPMSSSIFDSFDAAPPKPKPKPSAPKPSPSNPMSSSIFDSFEAAPPRQNPVATSVSQSDPLSSSIFDSFDAPQQRRQKPLHTNSTANTIFVQEVEKEQPFNIPSPPALWYEWRERLIHVVAARRFLRELARIISRFDGEQKSITMEDFKQRNHPFIDKRAGEVLNSACHSEGLMDCIFKSLSELSTSFGIHETVILEQALELISTTSQSKKLVFAVILRCLLGRGDLAEDILRDAAFHQMNSSEFVGFSNDTIVDNRDTRYYISSLWARQESSRVIWQLELCLWLCRGGAFVMSGIALKETVLAVRVGLAVVAWGRCHSSLDTLIKSEPDCVMDFEAGRNLYRSMKIITANENTVDNVDGVTSGGWEFLVDCRRDEATEMLRDGTAGKFLIRPHPQDPGVFTLSFKTNLVPTEPTPSTNYDETDSTDKPQETPTTSAISKKVVKRDDVVQHAIIRLSDSGFRW